ncbi:50S ribosomal protein L21 [Candidatus Persebacteraceae bacterium Df01]|jgi:large subunit ribosomal protein L21|uniref:Large ribosomal subunit protein bL21 n=1 Tax=Candidatus Doriopsillibacter californiensis TaxID=2970740 RepID=A0ABT7QM89_9GAMM|nr:50S ribosomal protein L21 [Candidatus Persebacteraceae bacterium Df01]
MTEHTTATFKTGGKQYRVKAGDTIIVESLSAVAGEAKAFDSVLLIEKNDGATVGSPFVSSASVQATVVEQFRGDKIRIFKMRRRKKSRRTQGHRQALTKLRIDSINI